MKRICLLLCIIILFPVLIFAEQIKFTWEANIEPDLAGYRLYQAEKNTENFICIDPNIPAISIEIIKDIDKPNFYKWYLTAYDDSGLESEPSIVKSIRPNAPKRFNCLGL